MQKALVIGLGLSGKAAAHHLLQQGVEVVGVDQRPEPSHEFLVQSDQDPLDLKPFDLVVLSPGISPNHVLVQKALALGIEVIGEVELAFRSLKGKVLAVTGTNGKTTVTLMTEHILKQAGIHARAAGNVGLPLTSELHHEPDVWVLELSSFQLETIRTRGVDVGVILNITPDHLDRYPDMQAYAQAKLHLANCLKPNGVLYIDENSHKKYGGMGRTFGYHPACDLYCDGSHLSIEYLLPVEYRGRVSHEVENFMACYALCRECGITSQQMTEGVRSFRKPAHRIEFVCRQNGITFYDDSKGTNIDAVVRAVETMEGETILIAGGVDKGFPYDSWIEGFKGKVSRVCAIGQAANKIAADLGRVLPVELFDSLETAVRGALAHAKPGVNILLSPGCSSFDMFRDYKHRGEEFKRIVNKVVGDSKT